MRHQPVLPEMMRSVHHSLADVKTSVADSASRVQDGVEATINGVGRSISGRLDNSRGAAAKTLGGAAEALHEKADQVSELGHEAAATVGKVARYVRKHRARTMLLDAESIMKRHPGKMVLAAVVVGFLGARVFRND